MELSRFLALALITYALILALLIPTYAQNSPQAYVAPHNSARSAVGVGPVTWSNRLEDYAKNYANKRKGDCRLVHSGGPYGENLFKGSGRVYTAADAVRSWVNEKKYYNYRSNTCQSGRQCGHYTQVVWRRSVSIGCARVKCNNGAWYIICNYSPRGNIRGQRPY